ncbi:MAG TPA: helix-turn-helix domain-containing protein, partial [Phototrophicaceae bacterium]|nr:helix-turn-helix domain-containing protein [Phototrophicaceae bacterium]
METSKSITHPMNTNSVATSDKMCPSLQALDILKDKWSIKVLVLLQNGPLRYMQIRRQAGGSTQKMLTQTLRKLEREGLITRTV